MDEERIPAIFCGIHCLQLFQSSFEQKKETSSQTTQRRRPSFVRRIGTKLPLGPAKRVYLHPDLVGSHYERGMRTPRDSDYECDLLWRAPSLVTLADLPWLITEPIEPGVRLRSQLLSVSDGVSDASTDSSSSILSASQCCCQESVVVPVDRHIDSGLSSAINMSIVPEAVTRIAELEAELTSLRKQLAMLVMAQETAAAHINGTVLLPRDMTSSPICYTTPHKSVLTLSDVPFITPSCGAPPPPPPPPPPPTPFSCRPSLRDIINQNKQRVGRDVSSVSAATDSVQVNMAEILKDLGSVKLKKIARSPGGTPFRVQRDPADSECSDPAALIARALRRKFASHRHIEDSPESSYKSPSHTSPDRSACWSPSPPVRLQFGRHILKPVGSRNVKRLSAGTPLTVLAE